MARTVEAFEMPLSVGQTLIWERKDDGSSAFGWGDRIRLALTAEETRRFARTLLDLCPEHGEPLEDGCEECIEEEETYEASKAGW